MPAEIRNLRQRQVREQCGTAHRQSLLRQQEARRKAVKGVRAAADHNVEQLGQGIHLIIRRRQPHLDIGMLGTKPCHARQQPAQAECRERVDAQHRGRRRAAALAMLLHSGRDAIECRRELREQRSSRRRQHHPPHRPPEQCRRPEPGLQQADLLADCTVRHAELDGGFLEAAEPGRRLEGTDSVQGWQAAARNEHGLHNRISIT